MSSSSKTNTKERNQLKDSNSDQIGDKLSASKRWSRDLSARRERELNRLNQIERRRQFLELRAQNDLFDQMSVAVKGLEVDSAELPAEESACLIRSDGVESEQLTVATATTVQQLATGGEIETSAKPLIADVQELRDSSNSKQAEDQADSGNRSSKQELLSQEANVKEASSDQLMRFIEARVPENKRVLCLIVRDKLSRFNKAKSYFCPTYYLFVQAILDTDRPIEQLLKPPLDGHSSVEDQLEASSPAGDNSFSASSSISADMLFIGASNSLGAGNGNDGALRAQGNSYSDNELHGGDTETEEEIVNGNRLTARPKAKPQGRDSPLVLPYRRDYDNKTADTSNKCNLSESGSLCAWSSEPSTSAPLPLNGSLMAATTATNCVSQGADNFVAISSGKQEEAGRATSVEMTLEDSNEELDEDDSDNEDALSMMNCRQPVKVKVKEKGEAERLREKESLLWFDDERNPYTRTCGVLLAGRRRKKAKTYLIGPDEYGYTRKNSVCKLKSNVLGTQFTAVRLNYSNNNDRYTIASISYETNVLGFKGPRKMRVFLAKDPVEGLKNLPETFKKDPTSVVQLKNMTPSWNVESQSYVLNFHGRVTQASVKNFQLIECQDHLEQSVKRKRSNLKRQSSKENPLNKGSRLLLDSREHSADDLSNLLQRQQQQTVDASSSSSGRFLRTASNSDIEERNQIDGSVVGAQLDERAVNSTTLNNSLNNSTSRSELGILDRSPSFLGSKNLAYNNSIVMQFGRISNHEFTCDVAHPLSILQAFAIALSSFDSKLACE